jgi:hypothetical protein
MCPSVSGRSNEDFVLITPGACHDDLALASFRARDLNAAHVYSLETLSSHRLLFVATTTLAMGDRYRRLKEPTQGQQIGVLS